MEHLLMAAFLYILVILLCIYDEDLLDKSPSISKHRLKIIAHRGAAGYAPENTIAAFDKAIELKADYIELDIQMSKDGELVVFHDTTLDRMTRHSGELKQMNVSSLKQLHAYPSSKEFNQNHSIPTLPEILDRYQNKIGLLLELKDPQNYPGIEKKLAEILIKRNLHTRKDESIIVQSFSQASIKRFFQMTKTIPTGLLLHFHPSELTSDKLKELSTFTNYINPPTFWTDKQLIEKIHNAGMKAFCWTVNDKQLFKKLKEMNVDGIITDYPDLPNQLYASQHENLFSNNGKKLNEDGLSYMITSFLAFASTFLKELQNYHEESIK